MHETLQDSLLFSLLSPELDTVPACFPRAAEKALHNDVVRQQLRKFQKRHDLRSPETEGATFGLSKLAIKHKLKRYGQSQLQRLTIAPLAVVDKQYVNSIYPESDKTQHIPVPTRNLRQSITSRLQQMIAAMTKVEWMTPEEKDSLINTFITEIAIRYHQIRSLSMPHLTPLQNRVVALSIIDNIGRIRDDVLNKCQQKKISMFQCIVNAVDKTLIDTDSLMKRALLDTEGGNAAVELDFVKPSEQLRKEVQEVKDALENLSHARPVLEPPTLLVKHQAQLIRRSMQSQSLNSMKLEKSLKLSSLTPRPSFLNAQRPPSGTDRRKGDNRRRIGLSEIRNDSRSRLPVFEGGVQVRIWDQRSDDETLEDPEPDESFMENDALDHAALAKVECENSLLQSYTGHVSFKRRMDIPKATSSARVRYLPPCKYRKRHLTDFDYAKLDAAPLPSEEHHIEKIGPHVVSINEDNEMRSAPSLVSERAPKGFITLAADPSTAVSDFNNESENSLGHVDEKLTRFKEVEELYDEIMRTTPRVHLDPMATEDDEDNTCPAAPIDPHMINSWLWQGLADPASLPTVPSGKTTAADAPRASSAAPTIRLRPRDPNSNYKVPPPLHPDEFIKDRAHAMSRTLSSRYNGALRYNYGGYIPGDVEIKTGTRVVVEPSVGDYVSFLQTRHTDFVFELIYKEDENAEKRRKEQEELERVRKQEEDMKRLENERKERADQRRQMLSYERGEWNPKIMDFIAELHDASVFPSEAPVEPVITETQVDPAPQAIDAAMPVPETASRGGTAQSAATIPESVDSRAVTAVQGPPDAPANTPRPISVDIRQMQQELEVLWVTLKMPLDQKLDMAIKYGGHRFGPKLETAIRLWKTASQHIITREDLLRDIEVFERTASDPDRFFQKGPEGSSAARLKEAKEREELMRKLHFIEARISDVISLIKLELKESVTYEGETRSIRPALTRMLSKNYKGAPYKEKMKSDYTDMIKRLHRERLAQNLQHSFAAVLEDDPPV
ncbi:Coiled-coil domain-containing protein 87 [Thoreauomyces humboldtii]|nr:Coiled-coil domain-containing protein 87 [Thoreauomyces humboldtii]